MKLHALRRPAEAQKRPASCLVSDAFEGRQLSCPGCEAPASDPGAMLGEARKWPFSDSKFGGWPTVAGRQDNSVLGLLLRRLADSNTDNRVGTRHWAFSSAAITARTAVS
jgi:hypothetical protein